LLIIRTAAPELREIGLLKRPRSPASQLRITDGERIGTGFDGWPEHWILTDNRHGKPHWAVTRCP
jgi:hypothetical protein